MSNIAALAQDLDNKYLSGAYHTFLFYLNTSDKFIVEDDPRSPLTLKQYLAAKSSFGKSAFTLQFNIGKGLNVQNEALFLDVIMTLLGIESDKQKGFKERYRENRKDVDYVLGLFSKILRFSPADLKDKSSNLFEKLNQESLNSLFSVYVNYLETIVPSESSPSSYSSSDRNSLVTVLELAQSMKIRKSRNVIVLVGESLASVASQLSSETNSIACLKIEFPNQQERTRVYEVIKKKSPSHKEDMSSADFGRLSSGTSTNVIVSFVSENAYLRKPILAKDIFEKKKKFIDEKSNGLMEVQRPLWGLNAIGGLKEHKDHILEIALNMKAGKSLAVPMGIMLMGPPGTGKTVLAEAISHLGDIPLVKYKNIRQMFVGQSERNLEFVKELTVAQAPVIVFIDEIDQQFQARGTAYHGDSGVGARMQGKFFEFMSDTSLRGKVLWIGVTNMPGSLDMAMREGRFDEWIPLFPPGLEDRVNIFPALIIKNKIAAKALGAEFRVGEISDDEIKLFAKMCYCRLRDGRLIKSSENELELLRKSDQEHDDAIYFTGGQMENLIRSAYSIALSANEPLLFKHLEAAYRRYNPPIKMLEYESSIKDAILHTNDLRFLPKSGRWKKFADRVLGSDTADDLSNL